MALYLFPPSEGDTDYINASLVEGCRMDAPDGAEGVDAQKEASPDLALPMQPVHYRRYILTQGPLPTTACHFWQMVWEQNSTAIVMLNKGKVTSYSFAQLTVFVGWANENEVGASFIMYIVHACNCNKTLNISPVQ